MVLVFAALAAASACGPWRTASLAVAADAYQETLPIAADAGIGPTMDVTVDADRAYTIGGGTFRVLDISQPLKPRSLGELSGLGNTRQIVVRRSISYIGSREDGVFIVDATDPAHPKLLKHYDSVEFATGMEISGDVLFVACRHYGVELVDVSTPAEPVHLSTVRTGEAQSVAICDRFLYAGVWGTSEVVVVDISNPRQPQIVARVPLDGYGDGLDICGKYLYAATGHHSRAPHGTPEDPGYGHGHGLEVFDLADPARPVFVSRVKFPPFYTIGNDMWGVSVVNDIAFVADTHNGMFLVDVADVKHPKTIGRCLLPHVQGRELRSYVGSLATIKDYVLVAGGWSDLHIVAAPEMSLVAIDETGTPPTIPPRQAAELSERYRLYQVDGQVHAVDFLDEMAIAACGDAGVHVVQLWPELKKLSARTTEGFATDVSVQGKRVYVAEGAGGLSISEMSTANELTCLGRYQPRRGAVKQVEVPSPGKFALIQVGANTFQIIDVSDPAAARLVLEDNAPGLLYGDQLLRGLLEDRYCGVFWHVSGVRWYDLYGSGSTPAYNGDHHPHRFGASNGIVVFQDKALATRYGGYVLLDRHERRAFDELPMHRVGGRRGNLGNPTIFDQRLYTADRATGMVTVVDISDVDEPKLVEQIDTPGNPGRISVRRGAMVIPDGNHGLMVFDR